MGRSESAAARDESSGIGRKVPAITKTKTVVVDPERQAKIEKAKEEGYLANAREKNPVWTNSTKQSKAFDALRKRVAVQIDDWKWDEGSKGSQADLVEWRYLVSLRKAYDSLNKEAGSGGDGGSGGTADTQKPGSRANTNKRRKENSVEHGDGGSPRGPSAADSPPAKSKKRPQQSKHALQDSGNDEADEDNSSDSRSQSSTEEHGDGGRARCASGEDSPAAKSKKHTPQSKHALQDGDNDEGDDDNRSDSRRPSARGKKRTETSKSISVNVEADPGSGDEGISLSDNSSPKHKKNKKQRVKSKSAEQEEGSSDSDGVASVRRRSSGKRRASRRDSQRSNRDEDRPSTPPTPTEERGGNESGAVTESDVEEDEMEQPEQTKKGLKGNRVYESMDVHALHKVQAVMCAQKMRGGGVWTTRFTVTLDAMKVTFTAASELADPAYHSKFMAAILQGAPIKDLTVLFKFGVTEVMR